MLLQGRSADSASRGRSSSTALSSGLSAEQQAFLARKASEPRSPSPAPTRGRSSTPARPSSRTPTRPLGNSASSSSLASSSSSWGAPAAASYRYVSVDEQARLSAEQCDFLERKRSGGR